MTCVMSILFEIGKFTFQIWNLFWSTYCYFLRKKTKHAKQSTSDWTDWTHGIIGLRGMWGTADVITPSHFPPNLRADRLSFSRPWTQRASTRAATSASGGIRCSSFAVEPPLLFLADNHREDWNSQPFHKSFLFSGRHLAADTGTITCSTTSCCDVSGW